MDLVWTWYGDDMEMVWRWYGDGTVQTRFVGERYSEKNMVEEIVVFK